MMSYNEDLLVERDSSDKVIRFTEIEKRVVKNGRAHYMPKRSFFCRQGHKRNG